MKEPTIFLSRRLAKSLSLLRSRFIVRFRQLFALETLFVVPLPIFTTAKSVTWQQLLAHILYAWSKLRRKIYCTALNTVPIFLTS